MKKLLSILLSLLLMLPLAACTQSGAGRYTQTFLDLFDTVSTVIAYDGSQEAFDQHYEALHGMLEEYHQLCDAYHDYDGVNNVKTLNEQAAQAPVAVDARLFEMLAWGKEVYDLSGGQVNICLGAVLQLWHEAREAGLANPDHAALPDAAALEDASRHTGIGDLVLDGEAQTVYFADPALQLDVGAIAKGYACQKVCEQAKTLWRSFALSLGGNVCTVGVKADGGKWRIGVENPDETQEEPLLTVDIGDLSVVTSGDYQRYYTVNGEKYCHIIDPQTLMPATYYASVSVLCDDAALADALSTTLFTLPYEQGKALVEQTDGVEALWVDRDGVQMFSAGFEDYIR